MSLSAEPAPNIRLMSLVIVGGDDYPILSQSLVFILYWKQCTPFVDLCSFDGSTPFDLLCPHMVSVQTITAIDFATGGDVDI